MKTDQEIKTSFNISVDEKNSVISIIFLKELKGTDESLKQTELVEEAFMKILQDNEPKDFNVIVDILELGEGAGDISAKHMKEGYGRMAAQGQVKKIAVVFGGNVILEVMANMIVHSLGKGKEIKFFQSREEALVWSNK